MHAPARDDPERLRPYVALLIVLALQLSLGAMLPSASWASWVNNIFLILALTVGGWAATETKKSRVGVVGLAVATSIGIAAARGMEWGPGELVALLLGTSLLVFVSGAILYDVLQTVDVQTTTLAGASCVYLLIGTVFGITYLIVELISPGSFTEGGVRVHTEGWTTYFSLVTLSTLGYGDILPVTRTARALASLEAIVGQLYLTILVARLVGLQLSRRNGQVDPEG